MEEGERDELARALIERLESRGVPDAIWLVDLLRLEQELADGLVTVRRLIDAITRSQSTALVLLALVP